MFQLLTDKSSTSHNTIILQLRLLNSISSSPLPNSRNGAKLLLSKRSPINKKVSNQEESCLVSTVRTYKTPVLLEKLKSKIKKGRNHFNKLSWSAKEIIMLKQSRTMNSTMLIIIMGMDQERIIRLQVILLKYMSVLRMKKKTSFILKHH